MVLVYVCDLKRDTGYVHFINDLQTMTKVLLLLKLNYIWDQDTKLLHMVQNVVSLFLETKFLKKTLKIQLVLNLICSRNRCSNLTAVLLIKSKLIKSQWGKLNLIKKMTVLIQMERRYLSLFRIDAGYMDWQAHSQGKGHAKFIFMTNNESCCTSACSNALFIFCDCLEELGVISITTRSWSC